MIEIGFCLGIGILICIVCSVIAGNIVDGAKSEAKKIRKDAEHDAEEIVCNFKKEAKKNADEEAKWIINEAKEAALLIVKKAKEEAEFLRSSSFVVSEGNKEEPFADFFEQVVKETIAKEELVTEAALSKDVEESAMKKAEKIISDALEKEKMSKAMLEEAKETADSIISSAKSEADRILEEHSKIRETTECTITEARESADRIINQAKEEAKEILDNADKKAKKNVDIIKFNLEQDIRIERDRIHLDRVVLEQQKSEFEKYIVYKEEELRQTSEGMIEKAYKDRALILDGINIDEYLISIGSYSIVKENILKTDVFLENDDQMSELKNRLKKNKEKQTNFKKSHKGSSCYVFGNAYKTYLCDGILSLGTTVFDVLCENINRTVTKEGVDASIEKLSRAVKLCETKLLVYGSYSNSNAHYYEDYIRLRIEELKITHDIFLLKERRKEEQREFRRQREEEARAQREYEREIKKAREDEVKAKAAIERARMEADKERENTEKYERLQAKIAGLEEALQEAVKRGERALSMAQQTKHGTVYVISNVGSFGEGVYKIGLTRRLEPFERVHELGDASVPFPFDVHAFIESDDAPALETALHQAFANKKLNMINGRKEFFRVSLDEIKEKVQELGYVAEWADIPQAVQFRDSEYFRENSSAV